MGPERADFFSQLILLMYYCQLIVTVVINTTKSVFKLQSAASNEGVKLYYSKWLMGRTC